MTREAQIRQTADEWLGYYHPACTQDMLVEAFRCGAEWADAHNPEIVYLKHEIERLKSKLQAADDLNTLLTAELEKAKSPWISVEDRLPEINQAVLTLGSEQNDEDVRILFRSDVSGNFVCIDYDEITHWMPIPINN